MTKISVSIELDYSFDFDGFEVNELIEKLGRLYADNPRYNRIYFRKDRTGNGSISLNGSREETDAEYESRMMLEEHRNKFRDAQERETYERLKLKFAI